MLRLKNLSVSVGEKKIIKNFSFDFQKGKVYVVMGPNGSGKSTLSYALMAHPTYELNGLISLNGENITDLDAQKRAEKGIFLSFQSPLSLSGVTVFQLLQLALSGTIDPVKLRRKVLSTAKELHLSEELLRRSLNENASGGEKKKLEVLQATILDKQVQIFDEVDTGVDVDALKTIGTFLNKNKKNKTYIIITHYNRILKYVKPDEVLVLNNGKLVRTGGASLAKQIERTGYKS
ncbi:Fe-S cluster assembly ATPase SufC [Candidatus Roizmanbacteria bacterium]|nr:MAG: Fe-S cluster assembly ATPase SufC [Candidatus Roizmanbacteria bacterium]